MSVTEHRAPGIRRAPGGSGGAACRRRVERIRYLAELQGFEGLDDRTLVALAPWLRLSPALCAGSVLASLVLDAHWLLLALLPFAIGGIVLDNHPFDAIYNLGVRRLTGGARIPRYGAPRRFACGLASSSILATWLAFVLGAGGVAHAIGFAFVFAASTPVVTGLCLPSLLYDRLRSRRRVAS